MTQYKDYRRHALSATGSGLSDYKEKTQHGDSLMPVRFYHCAVPNDYQILPLHWHEEMEITMITEGSIDYDINFETFSVGKGDLLLISPHILHSAHEKPGTAMISDSLVFHLDFLGCQTPDSCTIKFLNPILSGKFRLRPVIRPAEPGYPEMAACFQELLRCFADRHFGYELYAKELFFHFLRLIYQNGYVMKNEENRGDFEAAEKLKDVLAYIQEHDGDVITIRELADICHFSQSHFMNFFKRYTGITCVDYINQYRITRAAADLAETDRQIMDIALDHGYRNISYFNKVFREKFGVTPGQYRKKGRL